MAVDPVSAVSTGLSAVSMASGKKANNAARKDANKANAQSQELEKRAIKLWDTLFKRAQEAEASGQFDAEKRIKELEADTGRYEARDTGNLAGAMRVFGYKGGDSEVGNRLDSVKVKYRSFLDNLRNQIRDNSWWQQQEAYQSASPAILSGPMQGASNREASARSRIQNPSNFLGNLMMQQRGAGGTPDRVRRMQNFRLPIGGL